jgi:hypothetical protein
MPVFDPKDKRFRSSILVESPARLVVDTTGFQESNAEK